jgi:hypothetical protein
MPFAARDLRHLRDEHLRVTQRYKLQLTVAIELFLELRSDEPVAWPALCTIARLGVGSPPKYRTTPMRPSLPTTDISSEVPSGITYRSDTMESVGK